MKIITCILVLIPLIASAGDYPDCNIIKETNIFFSNDKVKDRLSIKIIGQPCYEAELIIQITDIQGKILYDYTAPFKSHIAVQWDDSELDEDAKKFAAQEIGEDNFKRTEALPVWMPEDEYYEENYQEIKVSKPYYEKLLQKHWITFTHRIHSEGWKVIVFDREQQKVILVSAGGL
jgi:hypothetical protein